MTNFALSKHLVREDEPLSDQRGSLAYISPDVLSGEQKHINERTSCTLHTHTHTRIHILKYMIHQHLKLVVPMTKATFPLYMETDNCWERKAFRSFFIR